MAIQDHTSFKIQYDAPTKIKWYSSRSFYGIGLSDEFHMNVLLEQGTWGPANFNPKGGPQFRNITQNKDTGYLSFSLAGSGAQTSKGANRLSQHTKALKFPDIINTGYDGTLGVKFPRYTEYPAFIDFDTIGYIQTLYSYKQFAKKTSNTFSSCFKVELLQTAQFAAPALARKDKIYLNPNNFYFYNVADNSLNRTHAPEHHWKPRVDWYKDMTDDKAERRAINDFKYYGTNLYTEEYIDNPEKKDKYIKKIIGEDNELLSFEPLTADLTKDTVKRYILENVFPDHYNHEDLTITVNGVKYDLDLIERSFTKVGSDKSQKNIIEYEEKNGAVTKNIKQVITFEDYSNTLSASVLDSDYDIIQQTIESLNSYIQVNTPKVPAGDTSTDTGDTSEPVDLTKIKDVSKIGLGTALTQLGMYLEIEPRRWTNYFRYLKYDGLIYKEDLNNNNIRIYPQYRSSFNGGAEAVPYYVRGLVYEDNVPADSDYIYYDQCYQIKYNILTFLPKRTWHIHGTFQNNLGIKEGDKTKIQDTIYNWYRSDRVYPYYTNVNQEEYPFSLKTNAYDLLYGSVSSTYYSIMYVLPYLKNNIYLGSLGYIETSVRDFIVSGSPLP